MVRKKSELSTTTTIDSLLPPVPSVPQILQDNLKYEQEMKKQEKLNKKKRKKRRKDSRTSTKFLPDWINDVQCDWAHSHDFRNYAKKPHSSPSKPQSQTLNKPSQRKHNHKLTEETKKKLPPSETSPAFESPAKSPDERLPTSIGTSTTQTDDHFINFKPHSSAHSKLSPLHELVGFETNHHTKNAIPLSRPRSTSKESVVSVGSDYGSVSNNEFESLPSADSDLQKEVSQHLEKFTEGHHPQMHNHKSDHRKGSSDSMLASELKKRYKTKIKQVGKSMTTGNIDDIVSYSDANKKKGKKKHSRHRPWRRKKRNKNMESRAIDEDHETDHHYLTNSNMLSTPSQDTSSATVLSTPSRDNSESMSPEMEADDAYNHNDHTQLFKVMDDEKTLQQIQTAALQQPKKAKSGGSMLSRLFSRFQTWTDKNRQAFLSYSQLLKTAVTQQEALIKQYQSELHNCKKQMSSELKRWKRWAQIEAENMARTYYENKYLLLSSQIDISMAKLSILQNIVNKVQLVLDGEDMQTVKHVIFEPMIEAEDYACHSKLRLHVTRSLPGSPYHDRSPCRLQNKMNRSFSNLPPITSPTPSMDTSEDPDTVIEYIFRNPNQLCLEPAIASLQDALPTLMDVESKLRDQYESLIKKIMVQQSASSRGNIYRQILLAGFKYKYLIRSTSQNFHYHPPDDKGLQVEFNCLLIDDRYPEGKLLRGWRKGIQKKYNKYNTMTSAEDVSDFLRELTRLILREYPIYQRHDWDPSSLDDKDGTNVEDIALMHRYGMKYVDTYYVLKLYLDRLVFPRLSFSISHEEHNGHNKTEKVPIWKCLYSAEEKHNDIEFAKNCEWMRNLNQSQLSIPLEYQKRYGTDKQISAQFNSRLAVKNNMIHPELPYYSAILSLNKAKNVYVPNDMLYCFIEGSRLINSAASEYKYKNDVFQYYATKRKDNALDPIDEKTQIEDALDDAPPIEKENVQLSADDLFPIMVWVIVHCRSDDIYMRLGYLEKFLDESIKCFGEVGMCLSLVQAAAEYIRRKEGWHFGLDQELDKETLNVAPRKNAMNNDEIV